MGAGFALAGGVSFAQLGNRSDLRLEHHELRLPRWDADGFRVALVTDLHMDSVWKASLAGRAIALAVAQKPDVLLLGGDFLSTEDPHAQELAFKALREAAASGVPTYGVLGNHDYWLRSTPRVVRSFERALRGPRSGLLRNETVEVDGVRVLGVDDGIAKRDRHDVLRPQDDKNVVCLFHEPDFVSRIDKRCSVMLAGHTHGGQVCLPFGIPLHTPYGGRTYKRGFYPDAPVPVYVSRGVGVVGVSRRAFCPPEVALLTLRSL
ncbi:MAG: metallophosphoesterase [Fimbriimonadaceae bacterium]|nr:metallophosphoesterase [Fimbriimonadaceae bacterium]QYK55822.1 MAG: metallophosphoesterase [Fimbriimonadaceae bacterium]